MGHGASRRDPGKESFWRQRVADHAAGGLSVRNFCRQHDLKEVAFYWWRRELARRDAEHADGVAVADCVTQAGSASSACRTRSSTTVANRVTEKTPASFVPVHVVEDALASSDTLVRANDREACCIEIVTGGRLVRILGLVDRQALTDVLEVLVSVSSAELERRAC